MLLPEIDPIIFQIGPVAIRWYGLTWLAAFSTIYFLIDKYQGDLDEEKLSDLMFYGLLGAIIGGRTGYIFFYSLDQFLENPLSIFFVWEGGLSFHGGSFGSFNFVLFTLKNLGKSHSSGLWIALPRLLLQD